MSFTERLVHLQRCADDEKANARLVAEAQEMLAALHLAVAAISLLGALARREADAEMLLPKIRAAIAKAEGE